MTRPPRRTTEAPVAFSVGDETKAVRSAAQPMAFGAWEFVRGALLTYLYFLPLTLVAATTWVLVNAAQAPSEFMFAATTRDLPGVLLIQLVVAGVWALGALVPASAVAFAIGRGLRTRASFAPHLLLHAANGLAFGALAVLVWLLVDTGNDPFANQLVLVLAYAIVTGAASLLGWLTTARLALRQGTVSDPEARSRP